MFDEGQEEQQKRLARDLIGHPRVEYQFLLRDVEDARRLTSGIPLLVPFGGEDFHQVTAVLDWDHKLPSEQLLLRVFAYYSAESAARGRAELQARNGEIERADRFPEFDVPDYAGVTADESYEFEIDRDGRVGAARLTSPWRRTVALRDARRAVTVVRGSSEFEQIKADEEERDPQMGGPEAVCYTPPCESGHDRWTVDVWYVLSVDVLIGQGRSFLVDLEDERVVGMRLVTLRPS